MKEACDVGLRKPKKQRFCSSPSLPHEIIENILSRLPVKDLLRFRVVCKQWKATISDPTFAEIHLQLYKSSSSRNLLAWENLHNYNGLHVAELRNNCIEFVSAIECGLDRLSVTLCSCDGLYLKYRSEGKRVKCVLWNPSSRTYRELSCPPSVIVCRGNSSIHAMYYDPLTKDYKIVFADMVHYAVYSCRDNKWGDVKEMKGFLGQYCYDHDVFVNGSIYWIVTDILDQEDVESLICFDCKYESFKTLALPNCKNGDEELFQLTSVGGQLCLFVSEPDSYQLTIMKKVTSADEWVEFKEECLWECRSDFLPEPLCQMSENELLFQVLRGPESVYMLYDKSKNIVTEIHNNHRTSRFMPPIAHVENLLLL